jgi:capsular polysaccharide biosynthesis protein
VAFTTKYKEYGHFLLETLPKLLLIRLLMDYGVRFPLIAPLDPPNWVNDFLLLIFKESELIRFSEFADEAVISTGFIPTLLGGGPFHPLLGLLIDHQIINKLTSMHNNAPVRRKLFISRARFRGVNTKDFRILDNEAEIQQLVIDSGYEVIEPQALPVHE